MEMPMISQCQASECAYNTDGQCHAMAITVGDRTHPRCDTFLQASTKGGDMSCTALVGACKVGSCMHNVTFECQASSVVVGHMQDEIDCLTFSAA